MMYRAVIILSAIVCAADNVAEYYVFPSEKPAKEGEELVIELRPELYPLVSCVVSVGSTSVNFTSNSITEENLNVKYWGRGLNEGECGVHILAYNSSIHQGKWTFNVSTGDGVFSTAEAHISTAVHEEINLKEYIKADFGAEIEIPCNHKLALYCVLFHPDETVAAVGKQCSTVIKVTKATDLGLWKCTFGTWDSIKEEVIMINVTAPSTTLDIEQVNNDHSLSLSCDSHETDITYCRMERPDGRVFVLSSGRISGRYSYFGSGITQNNCGIELKKPLEPQDIGIWKCTVGFVSGFRNSEILKVNEEKRKKVSIDEESGLSYTSLRVKQTSKNIYVLIGTSFSMKCSVNSILDFCFYQHPNGTRIDEIPENDRTQYEHNVEGLDVGQCGITISNTTLQDSGTWICGMGVNDINKTAQSYRKEFNVRVTGIFHWPPVRPNSTDHVEFWWNPIKYTELVENSTEVMSTVGAQAILACRSLQGQPLEYCTFTNPSGHSFNLTPNVYASETPRYNYHGDGLEHGDCGVFVNPVANEDFGMWECKSMLTESVLKREVSRNIYIISPSVLSGGAVAAIAGCVLIFIAASTYFACSRVRASRHQTERATRINFSSGQIQVQPPFTFT